MSRTPAPRTLQRCAGTRRAGPRVDFCPHRPGCWRWLNGDPARDPIPERFEPDRCPDFVGSSRMPVGRASPAA